MTSPTDKLIYGITQQVIGPQWFVPISAEKFTQISDCLQLVRFLLGVEERLDVALQNHFELEEELLRSSLEQMLHFGATWTSLTNRRLAIGRRIANVLSACSVCSNQLRAPKLAEVHRKIEISKKEQAVSLDYRLGRALRNFVTHNEFAAYQVTWSMGRDDEQDPPQNSYSTHLSLSVDRLVSNVRRDTELLEYLAQSGAKLDLVLAIRRHVQSVGQLHEKIRETLKADLDSATNTLRSVLDEGNKYKAEWVHIVAKDLEGRTAHKLTVSPEPLDYIGALRSKNTVFARLSQRYATGRSALAATNAAH